MLAQDNCLFLKHKSGSKKCFKKWYPRGSGFCFWGTKALMVLAQDLFLFFRTESGSRKKSDPGNPDPVVFKI